MRCRRRCPQVREANQMVEEMMLLANCTGAPALAEPALAQLALAQLALA